MFQASTAGRLPTEPSALAGVILRNEIISLFKSDYFSGSSEYHNQFITMGGFSQVLDTVSNSIRQIPILKTAENLVSEWLWLQLYVFHSFHVSTHHKIASEVPRTCIAL